MNGTSPQRVRQSLRQGEVLGLKWADVDLDQGLLRIRSTRTPKTSGLLHPRSQPAPNPLATVRSHSVAPSPMRCPCSISAEAASVSSISPAATNRPILNEATLSWWLRLPSLVWESRWSSRRNAPSP
jgi:hypothetical protein